MSKQRHLVIQHLENISWQVLHEYSEVIRGFIKGKAGIYILYQKDEVYYAGLASNLMARLKIHLKDNHVGLWDRFSVYLTVHDEHMKELESLLLRIIKPRGNKISGKFRKSQNLKPAIKRMIKEIDDIKRNRFIGGDFSHRLKKQPVKEVKRKRIEALKLEKVYDLRKVYKEKEYSAKLMKDLRVKFDGQIFSSPSASAKYISGRQMNGWWFWHYKNNKGDWVIIDELRK